MPAERSSQCDDMQPWLAAHALGEADADDTSPRAHVAACPRCQQNLREYRRVAALLPLAAPGATPAPDLRDRVIAAIAHESDEDVADTPATPVTVHSPKAALPAGRRFARAGWAALAFAALAVALLGWNIALQRQLAEQSAQISTNRESWQTMIVLLNDSSLHWYPISGDSATGHLWTTPGSEVACLVAQQLPAPGEGNVYQVWLVRGGEQISGGTFEARNGGGWVLVRSDEPLDQYDLIFVTAEPRGGSAAPSGPRVLSGGLAVAMHPRLADRQELLRLLLDARQGHA